LPNIREIAKIANVSHMTVSRYINKKKYVSAKNAAIIQNVIDQLNYRPNKLAQALNAKKTGNIALLVGDISNPITAKYTKGVEEEALRNNSNLIICNTKFDPVEEARCIVSLIEKKVDGIIIASSGQKSDYIDEIIERKIPLVFITRKPIEYEQDYVVFNDYDCSFTVVSHLIKQGFKRIAIIYRDYEQEKHRGRLAGYLNALRAFHIPIDDALLIPSKANIEGGYTATKKLLSLPASKKPAAIYTVINPFTAGCLNYCINYNIRIPEDIAVASFESFDYYDDLLKIPITANILPSLQLGVNAAKLLFERINSGVPIPTKTVILNCQFVKRISTFHQTNNIKDKGDV